MKPLKKFDNTTIQKNQINEIDEDTVDAIVSGLSIGLDLITIFSGPLAPAFFGASLTVDLLHALSFFIRGYYEKDETKQRNYNLQGMLTAVFGLLPAVGTAALKVFLNWRKAAKAAKLAGTEIPAPPKEVIEVIQKGGDALSKAMDSLKTFIITNKRFKIVAKKVGLDSSKLSKSIDNAGADAKKILDDFFIDKAGKVRSKTTGRFSKYQSGAKLYPGQDAKYYFRMTLKNAAGSKMTEEQATKAATNILGNAYSLTGNSLKAAKYLLMNNKLNTVAIGASYLSGGLALPLFLLKKFRLKGLKNAYKILRGETLEQITGQTAEQLAKETIKKGGRIHFLNLSQVDIKSVAKTDAGFTLFGSLVKGFVDFGKTNGQIKDTDLVIITDDEQEVQTLSKDVNTQEDPLKSVIINNFSAEESTNIINSKTFTQDQFEFLVQQLRASGATDAQLENIVVILLKNNYVVMRRKPTTNVTDQNLLQLDATKFNSQEGHRYLLDCKDFSINKVNMQSSQVVAQYTYNKNGAWFFASTPMSNSFNLEALKIARSCPVVKRS